MKRAFKILSRLAQSRLLFFWLFAFVFGVLLCRQGHMDQGTCLWALPIAAAATLGLAYLSMPRALFAALLIAGFFMGVSRQVHRLELIERSNELTAFAGERVRVLFKPDRLIERRKGYTVLWGKVESIRQDGEWVPMSARTRMAVGDDLPGIFRGDKLLALASIQTPRNFDNPGGFDYMGYLARRGVAARMWVKSSNDLALVDPDHWPTPLGLLDRLRQKYLAWLDKLPEPGGPFMSALLAGDRAGLSWEVRDWFSAAGLSHILAISGLHLGMVAGVVYFSIRWLSKLFPRLLIRLTASKPAALITILAVIFYAAITGMRVPTQRALVMVLAYLTAMIVDREHELWNTLALAACVILFIWPQAIWEASFQLSFTAVSGILYGFSRIDAAARGARKPAEEELDRLERALGRTRTPWLKKAGVYLLGLLAITITVHWAVFPLLVHYFHAANPMGVLYNLVLVPITGFVLLPIGMASSIVALAWPDAGHVLIQPANFMAGIVVWLAGLASERVRTLILLPSLSWWGTAAWYLSGLALLEGVVALRCNRWSWDLETPEHYRWDKLKSGRKPVSKSPGLAYPLAAISVAALLMAVSVFDLARSKVPYPAGSMAVSAINVGQGQSILVTATDGKNMLVDGGGFYLSSFDVGKGVVAPCLLAMGISHLDAVVLSHGHPDHGRGLSYVLSRFSVDEFWLPPDRNELSARLESIAKDRGIKIRKLSESTKPFYFGATLVQVLHPPEDLDILSGNLNNRSMVLKLTSKGKSVLLTGDIEEEAESMLIEKYSTEGSVEKNALRARVMSVPHHGSKTSSMKSFISAVAPRFALVSAAGPEYIWLPATEVMERYEAQGIKMLRTDQDDFTAVVLNGESVSFYKGARAFEGPVERGLKDL